MCGHEKTYQANFCHQLLQDGVTVQSVHREHRVGAGPVDVVLFARHSADGCVQGDRPAIAFEFKGGAYNTRNALHDEIDADGHCSDIDKLACCHKLGIESWFVCIDVAELGIALSFKARERVALRCAAQGINFAYFAQGEDRCLIQQRWQY